MMVKKNNKKRLFEVMGRLDKTFKMNEDNQIINPKYTHFATLKLDNTILNGWDYSDVDPTELRQNKKEYFSNDIGDMGYDPLDIKIVTTKHLQKAGINPFDINNWQ